MEKGGLSKGWSQLHDVPLHPHQYMVSRRAQDISRHLPVAPPACISAHNSPTPDSTRNVRLWRDFRSCSRAGGSRDSQTVRLGGASATTLNLHPPANAFHEHLEQPVPWKLLLHS